MGKKGHYNYSEDLRKKVIELHQQGLKIRQIAHDLDVPKSSVHNIIGSFKKRGTAMPNVSKDGRPRKTEPKTDQHILKLASLSYSVKDIQIDLESKGIKVNEETVRRRIKKANLPLPSTIRKKSSTNSAAPSSSLPPPPIHSPPMSLAESAEETNIVQSPIEHLKRENQSLREENQRLLKALGMKDAFINQLTEALNQSRSTCYACSQMNQYST